MAKRAKRPGSVPPFKYKNHGGKHTHNGVVVKKGETFESPVDLSRFNYPNAMKFEPLDPAARVKYPLEMFLKGAIRPHTEEPHTEDGEESDVTEVEGDEEGETEDTESEGDEYAGDEYDEEEMNEYYEKLQQSLLPDLKAAAKKKNLNIRALGLKTKADYVDALMNLEYPNR